MISAQLTPTAEARSHQDAIAMCLPSNNCEIFAAASPARIYHAQFGTKGNDWTSSSLEGKLIFGCDHLGSDEYWFRLIDTDTNRIVWVFRVPSSGFVYEVDRPFFHVFTGKSRRFGFLFSDDGDASVFAKEVSERTKRLAPKRSSARKNSLPARISPSMISVPSFSTFVHVSHIGINKEGVLEISEGLDPIWRTVLPVLPAQDAKKEEERRELPKPRRRGSAWKVRRMASAHAI
ncbi:hypothetical protein HGRIS_012488 [Hohenbuehelia grisea]|uniref:Uncharacterized protein n=1 Tax=Hohenbuehelia grisea TaxID=104357 RepID=A0ABR3ISI8_9AGAR